MDTTTISFTKADGSQTEPVGLADFNKAVKDMGDGLVDIKAKRAARARADAETGELLPYAQPTLDDKVFAAYTPEHQVGVKLTKGSDKRSLGAFGKLLSGERLERGREVIVTARYFAKTVHVPATNDEGLILDGDGLVELELLGIRSLEVGRQLLRQASPWKSCHCIETYDQEEDGDYPIGRKVLEYPLDGWSALQACKDCAGAGYTRPEIMPDDVNPEDGIDA